MNFTTIKRQAGWMLLIYCISMLGAMFLYYFKLDSIGDVVYPLFMYLNPVFYFLFYLSDGFNIPFIIGLPISLLLGYLYFFILVSIFHFVKSKIHLLKKTTDNKSN